MEKPIRKKKMIFIAFFCLIALLAAAFVCTRPRITEPLDRTRTVLESENADSFHLRYAFGGGKALEYTVSVTKKEISDDTVLLDIVLNQGDGADFSAESLRGSLRSSSDAAVSNIIVSGGAGIYTVPEVSYPDGERVRGFRTDGYLHLTALVSGGEVSLELRVTARENAVLFPERSTVTESFAVLG